MRLWCTILWHTQQLLLEMRKGTSLVVQGLRLHFQGVQFQSLVGELRFYILHGVDKIRNK